MKIGDIKSDNADYLQHIHEAGGTVFFNVTFRDGAAHVLTTVPADRG